MYTRWGTAVHRRPNSLGFCLFRPCRSDQQEELPLDCLLHACCVVWPKKFNKQLHYSWRFDLSEFAPTGAPRARDERRRDAMRVDE